jgi:hypothetical protein
MAGRQWHGELARVCWVFVTVFLFLFFLNMNVFSLELLVVIYKVKFNLFS